MKRELKYIACAFLCLATCNSCYKKEKPVPVKTKAVPFEETIDPIALFPELTKLQSIRYDDEMGYYIPFHHVDFTQYWTCDPVFIPSQSCSFTAKANQVEEEDFSGWYAYDVSINVLSDVHLPELATELEGGECPSAFKLHISLGENVPYRKVTLHDLYIHFPTWFDARISDTEGGYIPELEVTSEGVDIPFSLVSILSPVEFIDKDGKRCYSIETAFDARVSASPEDALVPVSDKPSQLDFQCTLEFRQIDFISCRLEFPGISFVEWTMTWDAAELPSFLCGKDSDIILSNPRILFEYQSDFPFAESRFEAAALYGDNKAAFSVSDNGKYMYMANQDGFDRGDVHNKDVKALGNLFRSPFPDGKLQPELFLQTVSADNGGFTPGKKYQMRAEADLMVPLAFTGKLDMDGVPTPALRFDGDALGAPGNSTHKIRQKLASTLPVDCRIIPVFTMDGEEPVFLDDFVLDKQHQEVEFSYSFRPTKDHWGATLHYLIVPFQGTGEYLMRDGRQHLNIWDTYFSANVSELN